MSKNDNDDDDNNGDLSFPEGFLEQSEPDEKPKTEISSGCDSVVTILFRKNEEPKMTNLKKSTKKKKANGHWKERFDECLICNKFIQEEDVHDEESLFR